MGKILITIFSLFTFLHAQNYELKPYTIQDTSKLSVSEPHKKKMLNKGLAVDIKPDNKSRVNYTVAYEGDFVIMDEYLQGQNQMKHDNIYVGIGYKF
jgi:hypothetical protein